MEEHQHVGGDISGSNVKIGTKSHGKRNAMWGGLALLAIVAIVVVTKMNASSDSPKLQALTEFRAAFAEKCNAPEFSGPTPAFLSNEYLNSTELQDVVKKEAVALANATSCADVEQALRTAAFPMGAKH